MSVQKKEHSVQKKEYSDRTEYTLNGLHHREDGPAIEYKSGTKQWWINGHPHREDGPAVEYSNGDKEYYLNGVKCKESDVMKSSNKVIASNVPTHNVENGAIVWKLNGLYHREDGPAVEYTNGEKRWCISGKFHRVNGPAIEWGDGAKEWWLNGLRHREDGPAIEFASGNKEWWLNGVNCKESDVMKKPTPVRLELSNRVEYRLDGKLHREDGPAIEWHDGSKHWLINGQFHREDGPALEDNDGSKQYYLKGVLCTESEVMKKPSPKPSFVNAKSFVSRSNHMNSNNWHDSNVAQVVFPETPKLVSESIESVTRIGVHQSKELILSIISSKFPPSIKPFIASEIGKSIIMFSIGLVLKEQNISQLDPIADELRISAITNVGNSLIEDVWNHIMPELQKSRIDDGRVSEESSRLDDEFLNQEDQYDTRNLQASVHRS